MPAAGSAPVAMDDSAAASRIAAEMSFTRRQRAPFESGIVHPLLVPRIGRRPANDFNLPQHQTDVLRSLSSGGSSRVQGYKPPSRMMSSMKSGNGLKPS